MRLSKKTWRNIIFILICVLAIFLLFLWYSQTNSARIERQNLSYASDSTRQSAKSLSGEFINAQRRISNYAYLLSLYESDITEDVLDGIQQNAIFDAIYYVNAEGDAISPKGDPANLKDRDYFADGMRGESGSSAVLNSRFEGMTVLLFYSPLYSGNQVSGLLIGVYRAEAYLQELLSTTYFGVEADAYLCTQGGNIIAAVSETDLEGRLPDTLRDQGIIDEETAGELWSAFRGGAERASFTCAQGSQTDFLCVRPVPDSDYILVQTFPKSVTQTMISNANRAGVILEVSLIGIFLLYIVILVIQNTREYRLLEQEDREKGYVIRGVTTLFTRFALANLDAGTYRYLYGTAPQQIGLADSGRYEDFAEALAGHMVNADERRHFTKELARETVIQNLEESINTQYEFQMEGPDGPIWEHINIICLERKDGRASKALFLRQDVTELKEKELRTQALIDRADRKEGQYRIAITSSSFCTFEFNLTQDLIEEDIVGIVDGKEFSFLKRVGLTAPCPASLYFEKRKGFVMEESKEDYAAAVDLNHLRECYEQGEAEVDVDFWVDNGQPMCVRQSYIMIRDKRTQDIIVMVVSKNITEQVQQQREQTQALQEALMQAQHANSAKSTFLFNMSHDIRTPMNAIIGFTNIAIGHIDNKTQVKDCLQKVLSSSNHLLSLINDILDMSRIESGKVQIQEQECNLSELTHNLVNIIQPQVKAKRMELFIDTLNVSNEDVLADSLKLSQVFVNLLSNAVKYTPADGKVWFRIQQQPSFHRGFGEYVFIVEDNGIGMSPEFVEHIFEPFEREASTTKTGIQGTGLGMAITKNIVEMMGGTISVESEKGKGSIFRVALRLKLRESFENTEKILELENKRILVVDDDLDNCESVSQMLKHLGMHPDWTASGREALYRARSAKNEGDPYHTYIIDWQMPEMSGIETARRLRSIIGNEAPIIVLTAYDWTDIEEEAMNAGVNAFCAKPLFMSDLKSALLAANGMSKKEEDAPSSEFDFAGKRVLLVEDNEFNREIAEVILSEHGFEVECAPDGTDAVAMVRDAAEGYYDVVLMDVQMPVMDGYEATRTIRALPRPDAKTLPIIAMTANAMEEDKAAALKSGMNAHIAKPLDMGVFMEILEKYLGGA